MPRFFEAIKRLDIKQAQADYMYLGDEKAPAIKWAVDECIGLYQTLNFVPPKFQDKLRNDILPTVEPGSVLHANPTIPRFLINLYGQTGDPNPDIVTISEGLGDYGYVLFPHELYRDRVVMPDALQHIDAKDDYVADAEKRVRHDRQYPDEPKQMRPGESLRKNPSTGENEPIGFPAALQINAVVARKLFNNNTKSAVLCHSQSTARLAGSPPSPGRFRDEG